MPAIIHVFVVNTGRAQKSHCLDCTPGMHGVQSDRACYQQILDEAKVGKSPSAVCNGPSSGRDDYMQRLCVLREFIDRP